MTGDDSPPARAYREYYLAILKGDVEQMGKYLAAANIRQFESMDGREREMVLELFKMRPKEVKINKPVVSGDQASFTVEDREISGEKSTGAVKMVLEEGAWKVLEDKWTM